MSGAHLRTVVERFYSDIWNAHERGAIVELLHPHLTFRGSLGPVKNGHGEFSSYVDDVHRALGEYRCDIIDLVVEGEKAFARMRFSGIHRAPFMGFAPTGKSVSWAGAALFTFDGDKVADIWVLGDVQGLLQLLETNAAP